MKLSPVKNFLITVAGGLFLSAISSCSADFDDRKDTPDPDDTLANRTILVYMESSTLNNVMQDLREMQKIGSTGSLAGNRLLVFNKNAKNDQLLMEVDLRTGAIDTLVFYDNTIPALSAQRLSEAMADTKDLATAADYGLVLWSHGSGWWVQHENTDNVIEKGSSAKAVTMAFGKESFDNKLYYFDIPVLAETLKNENLSFIYFDACYMACIEVLYDLKDVTPYVIASTAEVVWDGMPYDIGLPYLYQQKPDFTGLVHAVCAHAESLSDGTNDYCTIAAFDMSKVEDIALSTKAFYEMKPVAPSNFIPQKYMYQNTCYYFDFLDIINNLVLPDENNETADNEVKEERERLFEDLRNSVNDAVDACVIAKDHTEYIWPGERSWRFKIETFCGMSSNFITSPALAEKYHYNKTSWWNDVAKYQFE